LLEALVSCPTYERPAAGFAVSFAGKEKQVVKRVKRIVDKKNRSLHAGERALLMGGLLVLSAAFITIRGSRSGSAPQKRAITVNANPSQPTAVTQHTNTAERAYLDEIQRRRSRPVAVARQANAHPAIPAAHPASKPVEQPQNIRAASAVDTVPDLFRNASVDKWIECKDHGVTPEFVATLQKMGYRNFTLDQAIALKDHGVDLAYLSGFAALGYGNIPLGKAIELRDHGVRLEFVTQLKDLGFTNVPLNKLIDMVDHGVTVGYIAGMKKRMGTRLDLSDYIRLRDAGINPSEQQ